VYKILSSLDSCSILTRCYSTRECEVFDNAISNKNKTILIGCVDDWTTQLEDAQIFSSMEEQITNFPN